MEKQTEKENKKAAFVRLTKILIEKGIKPPDFQRMIGIASQDWTNWRNRGLPPKEHVKICDLLNINSEWLAIGKGSPYFETQSNAFNTIRMGESSCVPMVGSAQLVDDGQWCAIERQTDEEPGFINFPTADTKAYALLCVGDSMKPRIRNGEYVVIEPSREPQPGDDVVLVSNDGLIMVKTYLYTRDDRIHLMSINESHSPQSFAISEVNKMHSIAGIANKLLWVKNEE